MDKLFTIMDRFAPDAMEIMEVRYQILRQIHHHQPIGRRQLGKELGYTERMVRSEIDLLKAKGAILITAAGIYLTPYGEGLLNDIDEVIPFLFDIQTLAGKIKQLFRLSEAIIVPGDSRQDVLIKKDMGRAAARFLQKSLYPGCIVAVTGGSTLAEMAGAIEDGVSAEQVLIVPARGGLGEQMEQQAGVIAARIASAIGAQYRLLHIPDNLEENTVEILKNDIHVKEVVNAIKASNILMYGIGPALEMANRRGLLAKEIENLQGKEAAGEALRYYFNKKGKIVYEVPGIGLELVDLDNINTVVAVAGGSHKAEAITAVLSHRHTGVLITDEGAARKIIDDYNGKG